MLGGLADRDAIGLLLTCLNDPLYLVRLESARALEKLGWTPGDALTRVNYLAAKRDWGEMGKLGATAIAPLVTLLGDGDEGVKRGARETLTGFGEAAVSALVTALDSADREIRRNAAGILGDIGDRRAVDRLTVALSDSDNIVRLNAAVSLGKIKDKRAIGPLVRYLQDRNSSQDDAMWALKQFGSAAVEALVPLLKDTKARYLALETLGKIGDRLAIGHLKAAIDPDDERFNRVVRRVIESIESGFQYIPDD